MTRPTHTVSVPRCDAPSGDAMDYPIGMLTYGLSKAYQAPRVATEVYTVRNGKPGLYISTDADVQISAVADYSNACAERMEALRGICQDELGHFSSALEPLVKSLISSSTGFRSMDNLSDSENVTGNLDEAAKSLESMQHSIKAMLHEIELCLDDVATTLRNIADYELTDAANAIAAILDGEM